MADLVDTILINIGLNTGLLTKGLKELDTALAKLQDGWERHTKNFLAGNASMVTAITDLAGVLARVGVAVGFVTAEWIRLSAETAKRTQRTENVEVVTGLKNIEQIKRAFSTVSNNVDGFTGSLENMAQNLNRWKLRGTPAGQAQPPPDIQFLASATGIDLDKVNDAWGLILKYVEKYGSDQKQLMMHLQGAGLNPEDAAAIARMGSVADIQKLVNSFPNITDEQRKAADDWALAMARLSSSVDAFKRSLMALGDNLGLPKWLERIANIFGFASEGNPIPDLLGGHGSSVINRARDYLRRQREGDANRNEVPPGGGGTGTGSEYLRSQRERFVDELQRDQDLRLQLAATISMESEDRPDYVIEPLLNRMAMTGGTLRGGIHSGFYGPVNRGELPGRMRYLQNHPELLAKMNSAIERALAGGNVTFGATDQGNQYLHDPNSFWPGGLIHVPGEPGEVVNDWGGGPGGHEAAQRFREEQQRRVRGEILSIPPVSSPAVDRMRPITVPSVPGPDVTASGATKISRINNSSVNVGSMQLVSPPEGGGFGDVPHYSGFEFESIAGSAAERARTLSHQNSLE